MPQGYSAIGPYQGKSPIGPGTPFDLYADEGVADTTPPWEYVPSGLGRKLFTSGFGAVMGLKPWFHGTNKAGYEAIMKTGFRARPTTGQRYGNITHNFDEAQSYAKGKALLPTREGYVLEFDPEHIVEGVVNPKQLKLHRFTD